MAEVQPPELQGTSTEAVQETKDVHWLWAYTRYAGQRIYTAIEYFAEGLFWHLGITSPQYLHIIEMYEDMKEEERQEKEAEERAVAEAGLEVLNRLESQPDTNT